MGSCSRSYCSKLGSPNPTFPFLFPYTTVVALTSLTSIPQTTTTSQAKSIHKVHRRKNSRPTKPLHPYPSLPSSLACFPQPNAKQNPRVPHACMHAYLLPPPSFPNHATTPMPACLFVSPAENPNPHHTKSKKNPEMRIASAYYILLSHVACMQLIPYVHFTYLTYVPAAENFSMGILLYSYILFCILHIAGFGISGGGGGFSRKVLVW